jgi:threonine dehydrogenase-like Zn-dependent dehydrogenase
VRALVAAGPGLLDVLDRPEPEPGRAALVRVRVAGICGTDLKVAHGKVPARYPLILGHEVMGVVESPAPGSAVPAGARVVVDPAVSCGRCDLCLRDRPHLCPNGGLIGRDADGGFAELVAVPVTRLHVLPDGIGDENAVLVQMLSTVIHAQTLIRPQIGQSGLVVGLGASGLLHVRLLAARGVAPIVGISRSQAKRTLAERLGATVTGTPDEAADLVAEATGGLGADIAVECAGQRDALVQAMTEVAAGGTVLIFGTIAPSADGLPTYDWYLKELKLVSSRAARPRDFTDAIRAIRDGLVRPGDLITAAYPLEEGPAALAAAGRPEEIKVTMTIGGRWAGRPESGTPS